MVMRVVERPAEVEEQSAREMIRDCLEELRGDLKDFNNPGICIRAAQKLRKNPEFVEAWLNDKEILPRFIVDEHVRLLQLERLRSQALAAAHRAINRNDVDNGEQEAPHDANREAPKSAWEGWYLRSDVDEQFRNLPSMTKLDLNSIAIKRERIAMSYNRMALFLRTVAKLLPDNKKTVAEALTEAQVTSLYQEVMG